MAKQTSRKPSFTGKDNPPSWFEHCAGARQVHIPEADLPKDRIEFKDLTIEVKELTYDELTREQRAAFYKAFPKD